MSIPTPDDFTKNCPDLLAKRILAKEILPLVEYLTQAATRLSSANIALSSTSLAKKNPQLTCIMLQHSVDVSEAALRMEEVTKEFAGISIDDGPSQRREAIARARVIDM